jgi:lantibiotic transport system ATP-binding protein
VNSPIINNPIINSSIINSSMPTSTIADAVITIRGLEKHYGDIQAVRGLALTVRHGQIYGFLGPNGAGKTTTIRMLLGLIRPSRGEIRLFGQRLAEQRSVLGRIGSLVERPSAYGHLTGRENLEVVRRMLAAPARRVGEVLALVGLAAAADRLVRGYSLGMKGRLSLAAALLGDPELLVLDEPTNGLDPAGIREMRELIAGFPARGITVLLSSHLLAEIEQVATHIGIIAEGQMRFEGSLEALRQHAEGQMVIECDRPAEALALLQHDHPTARLEAGQLLIPSSSSSTASWINRRLVQAGFAVTRLEPGQASLEQLFLQLTSNTKGQNS